MANRLRVVLIPQNAPPLPAEALALIKQRIKAATAAKPKKRKGKPDAKHE